MQYTSNYNLKKPEGTDIVNIDDLNDNADILDQKLKEVENKADNAPPNSVNDAAIGSRTPDQSQAPASPGTGTLTQLISWLANRIKAITGKTNWWDAPPTTLQAAKTHMDAVAPHSGHETPAGAQAKAEAALAAAKQYTDQEVGDLAGAGRTTETVKGNADALGSHLSDYMLQIPYAITTGSANNYSILLNGVNNYYEGMAVAVKINVNNTGTSTINVNGLGAKTIKKPNGNNVSAGNLKAGSIYSMRYNGTNFILQGSASSGNATPEDVLAGKTFENEEGEQIGSMVNRGAVTITPGTTNKAITAGYHNGSGYVKGDANLISANIAKDKEIFGVTGTLVGVTDDVVYSKGTERILMVAGISSGTGSRSKESDHLYMYVNGSGDYAYVTDTLIDLTNVIEVIVLWEGDGTASGRGARCNISKSKTGGWNTYDARVSNPGKTFPKTISRIDTSALSGNYYIRVHSHSNTSGTSIVKVYRLILIYQI